MQGDVWKTLLAAFACFCMGASAVYLMNDIKDVEKDRMHPRKKDRPIAAGEIGIGNAAAVAAVLLILSYLGLTVLDLKAVRARMYF